MKIRIIVKQVGKRKPILSETALELTQPVTSLQELIEQLVTINVKQYNNQTVGQILVTTLVEQQLKEQADVGKIGFNVRYNPNLQDIDEAITSARLGFQDDLYKVYINNNEIERWQQDITLRDGDSVLFFEINYVSWPEMVGEGSYLCFT